MKKILSLIFSGMLSLLVACSIQMPVTNIYKLSLYSKKTFSQHPRPITLLVSKPEAIAGYQDEQMLYIQKPYALSTFAHNAWVSSPANMLHPLIAQSLQASHYFIAVSSSAYADTTDYRLDTQILELQQNFLVKPSVLQFSVKATLTRVHDLHLLASKTFTVRVPCPQDTPYGGVIAANRATLLLTAKLTHFVISTIQAS